MIYTPLMMHQERIVNFCQLKMYAGMFADYGTGKTLASLKIIQENGWKKVLVVSTKLSVKDTWPIEIRKHTNFRYVLVLGTPKQKKDLIDLGIRANNPVNRFDKRNQPVIIFLVNYDGVYNIIHKLVDVGFDAMFVDESTKIKSIKTKRTQVLYELGNYISYRYIMTGFPVTEALLDIFSQIKFLDRGKALGDNYYRFLNTYFVKHGYRLIPRKDAGARILKKLQPFCVWVTNESMHLPPAVYKTLELDQTEQQVMVLKSLNESFQLEYGKVKIDTQYIFALLSKSLQICDGFITDSGGNIEVVDTEKDEALLETLEQINVQKNKVVIWCSFHFTVKKILRILLDQGYKNVLTLTGMTQDESNVIQRFQHTNQYNILVATQQKASESITLTACRYAIYYSHLWSNDSYANSQARIRRKGSEHHDSIIYIDFLTKGSVEKQVLDSLKHKGNIVLDLKKAFVEMGGGNAISA
jgi:SNF2 family DNA or RNA helicase